MANKEGKFFEQLGMLAANAYEAGEVFQRITEGKMEIEDGVDAVHAIKKRARASLGKLYERMYKVQGSGGNRICPRVYREDVRHY